MLLEQGSTSSEAISRSSESIRVEQIGSEVERRWRNGEGSGVVGEMIPPPPAGREHKLERKCSIQQNDKR